MTSDDPKDRLLSALASKGRTLGGVGGMTLESNARSTFHEISAWDLEGALNRITDLEAENERLQAENKQLDARLAKLVTECLKHAERAQRAEAERDTAWNDAIRAAADKIESERLRLRGRGLGQRVSINRVAESTRRIDVASIRALLRNEGGDDES